MSDEIDHMRTPEEFIDEIRRLRAELARFREGMPDAKVLRFSSNNLEDFGDSNIDLETVKFLRRLADAGGDA